MKKKLIIVLFSVFLMASNVMADNIDDVVYAWRNLQCSVNGENYSIAESARVENKEQWLEVIKDANLDLVDSIAIRVNDFDADTYNINLLESYDVTTSASGNIKKNGYSKITYYFDYNPNYKLIRAEENRMLYDKLNIQEKAVFDVLQEKTHEITNDKLNDYEKELAIHNFITDNYRYGPANTEDVPLRAHSVVGFISDKEGICEAYANMFYLMCKMANLDVSFITGTANGISHMWNIINIDGENYHVDVTSDDPLPDLAYRERYDYFNVSDDVIARTHTWERNEYPLCYANKYNYHYYNNYIVRSNEDLKNFINQRLNEGKLEFTFRTSEYVINAIEEIKKFTEFRGFYSIEVNGEYGKESTYTVKLK